MNPVWTDGTSALGAKNLNTGVIASPYLMSGGIPPVPGSGLVLALPLTIAVVPTTPPQWVSVTAQNYTITGAAGTDNYVYLSSSGTYSQLSVTSGSAAPSTPSNTLPLFYATNTGGNIVSVTALATLSPVSLAMIQYDPVEASTNDTLTAQSTLINTLNRIRYKISQITGGTQSQIPVDLTEAQTWDTLSGASHLINNLNRIRYIDAQQAQTVANLSNTLSLGFGSNTHYNYTPSVSTSISGSSTALQSGSTDLRGSITLTNTALSSGSGLQTITNAVTINFGLTFGSIPTVYVVPNFPEFGTSPYWSVNSISTTQLKLNFNYFPTAGTWTSVVSYFVSGT